MFEAVIETIDRLQKSLDKLNSPVGKLLLKSASSIVPDDKILSFVISKLNLDENLAERVLTTLAHLANERNCTLVELVLDKETLDFARSGCEIARDVVEIWSSKQTERALILDLDKYERKEDEKTD